MSDRAVAGEHCDIARFIVRRYFRRAIKRPRSADKDQKITRSDKVNNRLQFPRRDPQKTSASFTGMAEKRYKKTKKQACSRPEH